MTRQVSNLYDRFVAIFRPVKESEYEQRKDEYEYYLRERAILIEGEFAAARSFDKYLITLSAGALALSITFLHDIAPEPKHLTLLILGWVSFIISLLSILCSFLISQHAFRRQRDILDDAYVNPEALRNDNKSASLTDWLNWTSLITFIVGVILLTSFSTQNLINKDKLMPNQNHEKKAQLPRDVKVARPEDVGKRAATPPQPAAKPPKIPVKPQVSGGDPKKK